MRNTNIIFLAIFLSLSATVMADSLHIHNYAITANKQKALPKNIPTGDYSGITYLGNDRYAVVSDKSATDGFFIFKISVDTITGMIKSIENEGFRSSDKANRDQEGIAFFKPNNTVFISGEKDNRIREHTLDGKLTGRELSLPGIFSGATSNYGLESLTYNAVTHRFWTTSESTLPVDGTQATSTNSIRNRLRLQSFNDSLQPAEQYFYDMDAPTSKTQSAYYAMGVSELCALDNGDILILEREFFVPKRKIGTFVICKLYVVHPDNIYECQTLPKRLLTQFKTSLNIFNRSLANYEGMCIGPTLPDGKQILFMISDSQSHYKGVLKDWIKTLIISSH